MKTQQIVLASGSPYRRQLLARLQLPFDISVPDVDETPLPGETPEITASRLARAKARRVAEKMPDALIIGSDQVAVLEGVALGKPLAHENAVRQLRFMSGKTVVFHTALCLLNGRTGRLQEQVVPYRVTMRSLTDAQIEHYLEKEQPYQCAGSARTEGLGIALIASMQGDDPNALIGLPLIALVDMLAGEGVPIV
ncbi:MAG: septum formation inhibitor Maf [Betaproteobacteria bacterium]|nr:septum formation inhibitor Maf [Betaproteobacteria bacterium]